MLDVLLLTIDHETEFKRMNSFYRSGFSSEERSYKTLELHNSSLLIIESAKGTDHE